MKSLLTTLFFSTVQATTPHASDTNGQAALAEKIKKGNQEQVLKIDSTSVGSNEKDHVISLDNFLAASGDAGVLGKNFSVGVSLWKKTDLNTLYIGEKSGPLQYEVKDAKTSLEGIRKYIEKEFVPLDGRQLATIEHINKMLVSLEKENTDSASVARLNEAVKDNVIDPQEDSLYVNGQWQVTPGHYMLFAKSTNQSVPILIKTEFDPTNPPEGVVRESTDTVFVNKETLKVDTVYVGGKGKENHSEKVSRIPLEIIAGATIFGKNEEGRGVQAGLRYGPVAIIGSHSWFNDETVPDIRTNIGSDGIYSLGKNERTGLKSYGIAAELHPLWNFFAGAGVSEITYTDNITEQLRKISGSEDYLIKETSNSKSGSDMSTRFYGGLGVSLGKIKADVYGGHDSQKGIFAGARLRYQVNHKSKGVQPKR